MPFRYSPSLVTTRQLHNCPLYCFSSPIRLLCTAATMRPSWLQASCRRSPRRCYHSEPSSCVLSRQLLASTVLAVLSGTNLVFLLLQPPQSLRLPLIASFAAWQASCAAAPSQQSMLLYNSSISAHYQRTHTSNLPFNSRLISAFLSSSALVCMMVSTVS